MKAGTRSAEQMTAFRKIEHFPIPPGSTSQTPNAERHQVTISIHSGLNPARRDERLPLSPEILLSRRVRTDRRPLEVALLAHARLDHDFAMRIDAAGQLALSSEASELLAVIASDSLAVVACGLTTAAGITANAIYHKDPVLAEELVSLAEAVDTVTVTELLSVGPVSCILSALESVKARIERTRDDKVLTLPVRPIVFHGGRVA
jgi:hypothetical protein